jgi:hypothetical protein
VTRYEIGSDCLSERPVVRFGDRDFTVDNRLRVFQKIGEELKAGGDAAAVVLGNALGEGAYGEIAAMNPPYPALARLVTVVMAAIQGLSEEEAKASFRGEAGRGAV